jgi:dTDP-4-dehydrorhamnose reductase
MKILVIGAEGQVGHFLISTLSGRHEVYGTSLQGVGNLPPLDIRQPHAVREHLRRLAPDYVILAAALTHVDYCEEHPDEAEAINVLGTEHVAQVCQTLGAGLTFFSTDYIFDGRSGPYGEDEAPNPLSVYGRTKLAGERIVADRIKNHLIVRTMVVYSHLIGSLNLFMQLQQHVLQGEAITQPSDQWINPTQAVNLAKVLAELLEAGRTGAFNLAGTTRLTRLDFAKKVVTALDGNPRVVKSLTTAELAKKAPRPLNSGLKTEKAQAVLKDNRLWDLDTALDYTIEQTRLRL